MCVGVLEAGGGCAVLCSSDVLNRMMCAGRVVEKTKRQQEEEEHAWTFSRLVLITSNTCQCTEVPHIVSYKMFDGCNLRNLRKIYAIYVFARFSLLKTPYVRILVVHSYAALLLVRCCCVSRQNHR